MTSRITTILNSFVNAVLSVVNLKAEWNSMKNLSLNVSIEIKVKQMDKNLSISIPSYFLILIPIKE